MEISLMNCIYAVNPSRIIYIECYKLDPIDKKNPYSETGENKLLPVYNIIIHMTDDKIIEYHTKDISEYENLRDELKKIVGG